MNVSCRSNLGLFDPSDVVMSSSPRALLDARDLVTGTQIILVGCHPYFVFAVEEECHPLIIAQSKSVQGYVRQHHPFHMHWAYGTSNNEQNI